MEAFVDLITKSVFLTGYGIALCLIWLGLEKAWAAFSPK
jgi:hypothetical protein